jgi:pimeloyl-ACP methyl ester carboxylesterase
VPVTDGQLVVHVLGDAPADAPTVLALHSISSNGLAWVPVSEALAGRVRLLAPDLRGRAESAHLRSTGLADHARDALAEPDEVYIEDAGHACQYMGAVAD